MYTLAWETTIKTFMGYIHEGPTTNKQLCCVIATVQLEFITVGIWDTTTWE